MPYIRRVLLAFPAVVALMLGGCAGSGEADQRTQLAAQPVQLADGVDLTTDNSSAIGTGDAGSVAHRWTDIDQTSVSNLDANLNLVITDAGTWAEVWTRHAGARPLPQIDFGTRMVIAAFGGGGSNGCDTLSLTAMTLEQNKLVVVRTHTRSRPVDPSALIESVIVCTAAFTRPAHLVAVDRVEVPVEFVVKQRAL